MDKTTVIDIAGIKSKAEFHNTIKRIFNLPDYYGGNLDALNDILSEVATLTKLHLKNTDCAQEDMKRYILNAIKILEDAADENPNIILTKSKKRNHIPRKMIAIYGSWKDIENLNNITKSIGNGLDKTKYIIGTYAFPNIDNEIVPLDNSEDVIVDDMLAANPAAIVVFGEMITNQNTLNHLIEAGHKLNIPVFMFEHKHEGCINITFEYKDSFKLAVNHVIEDHNFTDIHMIAGYKDNPFSDERIDAYKEALEAHGIPFDANKVFYGDFWNIPAGRLLDTLLDKIPKGTYKLPQAYVCANDSMAIGVTESLQKHGYKIPQDVIVTGFDGIWHAKHHYPAITTCEIDFDAISDAINETINNWGPDTYNSGKTLPEYKIGYKLTKSQSCGCKDQSPETCSEIIHTLSSENNDYFQHMLTMGKFVTKSVGYNDPYQAINKLISHLWLWTDQYFFVGLDMGDGCVRSVIDSVNDVWNTDNTYYNQASLTPNIERILDASSGINFLVFGQLNSDNIGYGHLCIGFKDISLRAQQRFEEFRLFTSAAFYAILNNQKLSQVNKEISKLSELDYLTGLYNRRGFLKRIDDEISTSHAAWLTYFSIDIDGLKSINDTYGHNEGDVAIKVLADAIQKYALTNDAICARYGGDEFAFVVFGPTPLADDAELIRERIEAFAAKNPMMQNKPYEVKASIGVADTLVSSIDMEDLINTADKSMYTDKTVRKKNRT